jgi:photosystem II stability/assembly factor-like uncharacterized protein
VSANHTLFIAGLEEGVRVSIDRGATWSMSCPDAMDPAVYALAVSAPGLYAATSTGVHVSRDNGATWYTCMAAQGTARAVAAAGTAVVASMHDGAFLRSEDGGASWRKLSPPFQPTVVTALGLSDERTIFVATLRDGDIAIWRSNDGGAHWLPPSTLGPNRITSLATSPEFAEDHTVFATMNAAVYVSRDGGESFTNWSKESEPPRIVSVAVSPNFAKDRLVYALGLGGTLWRRPLDRPWIQLYNTHQFVH